MNKKELKNKMQSGFLETAPDVYESVLKAAENSRIQTQKTQFQESEKFADGMLEENDWKKPEGACKGRLVRGKFSKYALSACAGFALFFMCLFGVFQTNQDNICVVMDINPSIQIVMNKSCQVKKMKGLNQDGRDVIKKLEWRKGYSLLDTVDVLLERVAEDSYLHEGGGILVTVSASDTELYHGLEEVLGVKIDGKLEELGVRDVTTAFRCTSGSSADEGRKLLEAELAEKYGVNKEKLRQMSVVELIQYCQSHTSMKLKLSPVSEKKQAPSKPMEKKDTKKKKAPQSDIEKTNKDNKNKADTNVLDGAEKPDEKKTDHKDPEQKKSSGQDEPSQSNDRNSGNGNAVQPEQNPVQPTQPETPSQPESQPQPETPPQQNGGGTEQNPGTQDNNSNNQDSEDSGGNSGNNGNNGNKDNNSNNGNVENKDNNNNKDNSNKDTNNRDNGNKDHNNKDNENKDHNNKDNDKRDNNNKNNGNK